MRRTIRLKESELKRMIAESVKRVLRESYNDDDTFVHNYRDAISDEIDDYDDNRVYPSQRRFQHDIMNNMQKRRDVEKYWTDRDLERADIIKKRWIQGKRSTDSLEDADFDLNTAMK